MKLPNKVRAFRAARNLTQDELSLLAHIKGGKSRISVIEKNHPVIGLKTVYNLSKALKEKPTAIFLFDELYS